MGEAARTKAAKEEATASFRIAHAAATRAEQRHELAVAALSEGKGEERRLRHELLNLAAGRKWADAEYKSAVAILKSKLVSVATANESRGAAVEKTAREQSTPAGCKRPGNSRHQRAVRIFRRRQRTRD